MAVREPAPPRPGPYREGLLLKIIGDQRVAFLIVGGINTLIGLGWFVLFYRLLGSVIGYMGTLVLTHVCAVLCAFVLHRRFVFRVRGGVWLDLARFELVNLGALAANAVVLPILVEWGGLPVVPAQVVATVISVVTTYVGHRAFSFRRKPQPRAAP